MMGEFESFIKQRFGIHVQDHVLEERKSKVYLYSQSLIGLEGRYVQRRGILAGKLDTLYGIKPSLDFVLLLGHLAVYNVVQLGPEEIRDVYMNKPIENENTCSDGLVLIKDSDGLGAGIALRKGKMLYPLTPKDRMISAV